MTGMMDTSEQLMVGLYIILATFEVLMTGMMDTLEQLMVGLYISL